MQNKNPQMEQLVATNTQKVVFREEAHDKLLAGAEKLAKAVASTMGPSGHSVIIDNISGTPSVTKDGVTVARSIHLKDRLESMGAELLKEIASKTNDLAGDGPQPTYAKVLTPQGWTTMGKVKVGDTICGTNRTFQKVLGVYHKGTKDIYRVVLADGNIGTRTVECSEEHLWYVTTARGSQRLMTTKQMLNSGIERSNSNCKYFVKPTCVEFANTETLPLDPYLLGVLLGDGSLSEKGDIEIAVGLNEEYILNKLNLPEACRLRKQYYTEKKHYIRATITGSIRLGKSRKEQKLIIKNILSELGLIGTNNHTKFIPKNYLYSPAKDRQLLLEGLIDTGGSINNVGLFEFSTVSRQLYLDFIELCMSLGKSVYGRRLTRKQNDGSFGTNNIYRVYELKGNKQGLKIKSIKKLNKQTKMMCIKVSNDDHLYITNDFIPTHNTTTATVLGHAILKEGIKQITSGHNSIQLKRGIDVGTKVVIEFLKENCVPVGSESDIVNVGTISANGDREIGSLICSAIQKVGRDGIITIEPAKSVQTHLEVVEGMQIENGYVSPFFVTNSEKAVCDLDNPYVLMTSNTITSIGDIVGILEKVARVEKSLLIVADEVGGDALHTLIVNKMKGILKVCAIKAPSYGEHRADMLNDLSILVGGVVFGATNETSLKNATLDHLGKAKKIIVGRKTTVLVGDPTNEERRQAVQNRVVTLRNSLENDNTLDDLRVSKYRERLAKLSGGIAVIKVGGSTEVEILEKKDRVEDAVNATMAATQEGIVPGGGVALFYAAQMLRTLLQTGKFTNQHEDAIAGIRLVANVCEAPMRTIVGNTGKSPEVVANELNKNYKLNPDFRVGYNAASETYTNLINEGIIDPVKVTRLALEHAVSVVGLMLTCNAVVVNETEQ